ncbi:MAG: Ig-like domain-containing protein [Acutalibacteraceae bacterium]
MSKSGFFKKSVSLLLMFVMMFTFAAVQSSVGVSAASKKVTVKKVAVTNLNKKVLYVAKGKTVAIKTNVTVTPNKAANKKVTYKSKKASIAKVDNKGKVKGVKNGSTKITVTSKLNKKKKTTFTVKVTAPVKKVSLNKTSVAMVVGASTTVKASVSPTKNTCKAVSYKSSNTKVATVTAAGKIVAKAAGTAKITATSVDGTNKKAVCTVTVSNPTNAVTPTGIVSAKIINPENRSYSYRMLVTLNQAKVLSKADFVIKEKSYANGTYNNTVKIDSVYTPDNKNYYVTTYNSLDNGLYYNVTVNALDGNKSYELFFKASGKNSYDLIRAEVGESIDEEDYYVGFSNMLGYTTRSITSGTLPAGIKYDADSSSLQGTFKAVANNQKVVISAVDELKTVSNATVNFLVGDENHIYVESLTVGADEDKIFAHYYNSFSVGIVGGSGEYRLSLENNYNGMFGLESSTTSSYADIYTNSNKVVAGTYNLQLKVTDANNTALTATSNVQVIVTDTVKVSTALTNATGYTEICYRNIDLDAGFWTNNYESELNKLYDIYMPVGYYNVYTYDVFDNRVYLSGDISVTGNQTFTFTLPVTYKLSGTAVDKNGAAIDCRVILENSDEDWVSYYTGATGEFEFINVPNGSYKVEVYVKEPFSDSYNKLVYTSQIQVNNNITGLKLVTNYDPTNIQLPETVEELTAPATVNVTSVYDNYVFIKFTPSETGEYDIYSVGDYDTEGAIFNAAGELIDSNDDTDEDNNFFMHQELNADEEYYIGVADCGFNSEYSFDVVIEKCVESAEDIE